MKFICWLAAYRGWRCVQDGAAAETDLRFPIKDPTICYLPEC